MVRSIKIETCIDQRRFRDHLSLDVATRNYRRSPWTGAKSPGDDGVSRLVIGRRCAPIRDQLCCTPLLVTRCLTDSAGMAQSKADWQTASFIGREC
jgi:hypothetical protein